MSFEKLYALQKSRYVCVGNFDGVRLRTFLIMLCQLKVFSIAAACCPLPAAVLFRFSLFFSS